MSTDLTKPNQGGMTISSKPAFMAKVDKKDYGLGTLVNYVRPPMLKVVQALTKPPVKPPFAEGDAVIIPHLIKIGDKQTSFEFVPICFFPSWMTLNPLKMPNLPNIREMSLDPKCDIAIKAENPSTRLEPCPENTEYKIQHCNVMNYIVLIDDDLVREVPILVPFSRGEFVTGSAFGSLIQIRNAPMYGCRFQASIGDHRDKVGNVWPGLDIVNAAEQWVTNEQEFNRNQDLAAHYRELYEKRQIEIDPSDLAQEETEVTNSEFA